MYLFFVNHEYAYKNLVKCGFVKELNNVFWLFQRNIWNEEGKLITLSNDKLGRKKLPFF